MPLLDQINLNQMNGKLKTENNVWPQCMINIYLTCDTGEMALLH